MADFSEKIDQASSRIPTMEHMLGSGLQQPFNNTNSGQRKIMHKTHRDHILPLFNGEKAIIETGYEIRYGDLSSSITVSDQDFVVVAKISKFSFAPNHHYWLILEDPINHKLDVIERISYHTITESYGYLYNNQTLDALQIMDRIPKDTILQKSLAFDEFNNRKDGANFNVVYLSLDQNMEDSIIFSDVAAARMDSPLLKPMWIPINENDIPKDTYGKGGVYKCIPDIGEDVQNAILITLGKEKKEESLYNQSTEHLKKVQMSDKKYGSPGNGKVVDIEIYVNNVENLDKYHNAQFKMYYLEKKRMATEIVQHVMRYVANGYQLTYDLQKLYANAKRIINNDEFTDKKPFSNILLNVVILEDKELEEGDKASNRFGGKGIVSKIIPQHLMPQFEDGEYADIIMNPYSMPNRENVGQNFECEQTFIGGQIIKRIMTGEYSVDEAMDMIYRYLHIVSPKEEEELRELIDLSTNPVQQAQFYIESIIAEGGSIHVSALPISESFDIDRLDALYQEFPWIGPLKCLVPMKDSEGNIRKVETRKRLIYGKEYIFRLKQYAEEKFSANSLSATNIRSENAKSKASRNFTELYRSTPIRFGNMEINDMIHAGVENVVTILMIHSTSPRARRLVEEMYTGDPFQIDIRLDEDSSNRSAEIVNTYLKTIGRRLVFKKIKIVRKKAVSFRALRFVNPYSKRAVFFNKEEGFDGVQDAIERQKFKKEKELNPNTKRALYFDGRNLRKDN